MRKKIYAGIAVAIVCLLCSCSKNLIAVNTKDYMVLRLSELSNKENIMQPFTAWKKSEKISDPAVIYGGVVSLSNPQIIVSPDSVVFVSNSDNLVESTTMALLTDYNCYLYDKMLCDYISTDNQYNFMGYSSVKFAQYEDGLEALKKELKKEPQYLVYLVKYSEYKRLNGKYSLNMPEDDYIRLIALVYNIGAR